MGLTQVHGVPRTHDTRHAFGRRQLLLAAPAARAERGGARQHVITSLSRSSPRSEASSFSLCLAGQCAEVGPPPAEGSWRSSFKAQGGIPTTRLQMERLNGAGGGGAGGSNVLGARRAGGAAAATGARDVQAQNGA